MATVAGVTLPAESFVLGPTLSAAPETSVVCEPTVASGGAMEMPLLRVDADDREAFEEALATDPSVETHELLASLDDQWLYRVEWSSEVRPMVRMIASEAATIVSARADGRDWTLRLLYPDRDALAHAHERCQQYGIDFDLDHVQSIEGESADRYGITDDQREALTTACERGYFEIPRQVGLRALASDLDISHRALSERLRRGHDRLIRGTLIAGDGTTL